MSVQNLREKFNQPCNGTISPPGTSFGSVKSSPSTKIETLSVASEPASVKPMKTSPFGPSINGKVPNHFLRTNKNSSISPDRLLNSTPKPYTNGCLEAKTTTRKSPEQSQQDIILRKWSGASELSNSFANKEPTTAPPWTARNSESPFSTLSKPKKVISRYLDQLTNADGSADDSDSSTISDISSDRAEQLKNKYEINGASNVTTAKWEQPSFNGGSSADRTNSSFLHSVREKMNGDTKVSGKNMTSSSLSNGLKKTSLSDKWKVNGGHEEAESRNTQTNKGESLQLH